MERTGFDRRTLLKSGGGALAAAALGSSIAGCSNAGRGGNAGAAASQNASVKLPTYIRYTGVKPDLAGNDAGVTDAFFSYPMNPKKATTGVPGDGKPITALVQTSAPIPPGVSSNRYWQQLNKLVGSDLQLTITPASNFPDKFATTVAGGDLPDMTEIAAGTAALPQLLAAKAQDLSEHLSGDAIKDYPFLANIPTNSWKACVFNGGIFGIPVPRGVLSTSVVYRREDLFKAQGIDASISNFDDFFALCQKINAPGKNRWALATTPIDYLREMLGVANGWKNDGGKLTSAYEASEQTEALAAGVKLVKAGVVHPDSFSDSVHEQAKTWFNGGSAYMIMDTYSALPGFYGQNTAGKSFDVGFMDLPGFTGGQGKIWLGNPTITVTAFAKSAASRVKPLLQVANWLAAPFGTEEYLFRKFGVTGVDYRLQGSDPVLTSTGNSEAQLGQFAVQYLTDTPMPLYYPGLPKVAKAEYAHQQKVIPGGILNPTIGLYSGTDASKGGQLTTKMTDTQNAILQGRQPVSAWEQAVKSWRSGGGDTIRGEYEKALADK